MNKGFRYWTAMAILAFASVICFFQVNSYWSDKHHFNTWFIVIGIVLGLGAIYCLRQANELQDN